MTCNSFLKSEYLDFDLRSTNSIKNLTFCNHPNLDPELRPSSCGWVLTHIHMFLCIFVLLRICSVSCALTLTCLKACTFVCLSI